MNVAMIEISNLITRKGAFTLKVAESGPDLLVLGEPAAGLDAGGWIAPLEGVLEVVRDGLTDWLVGGGGALEEALVEWGAAG